MSNPRKAHKDDFSALWLTGGNFKSKQPFPFGLSLADLLSVKEGSFTFLSYSTKGKQTLGTQLL